MNKGLSVQKIFPDSTDIIFDDAPFDGFMCFNFLEHQPDPKIFLKTIRNNLVANGCGLITVPSIEYISEQNSYYEIIPDHIAYFTMNTLCLLAESCGFDVLKKEDDEKRSVVKAYLKTILSYAFTGLLLSNVLLYIGVDLLNLSKTITPLISLVITVPLNFILNKLWAFRQSKSSDNKVE